MENAAPSEMQRSAGGTTGVEIEDAACSLT